MVSIIGILGSLARQTMAAAPAAARAAPLAPKMADRVQITVLAMGLCVLAVWIVRRLANPRKLLLIRTPGRPNRLVGLHLVILLLAMLGLAAGAQGLLQLLMGKPPEKSPAEDRQALLAMVLSAPLLLAAALGLARNGFRHGLMNGMGLSTRHWLFDSFRGLAGFLAIYPICVGLEAAMSSVVPPSEQLTDFVLNLVRAAGTSAGWKVLAVVAAVVLAPITEEVMYRGILQSFIRQRLHQPWLAIVITSAVFAAMHFDQEPQSVPALFALAVGLGYNYECCGRLGPSMLIHMLFNALSMTLTLWLPG